MPALIFVVVMTQLPFVMTIVVAFMRWNALYPGDIGFAGLANFKEVFADPALRSAVMTSLIMTVSVVAIALILGLGVALLVNMDFPGRGIVRTMMIAPFLIVPVAAALLWKHVLMNPSYGLFNGVIQGVWNLFGWQHPPQPEWVTGNPLWAVMAAMIWQWTPFMMLIILAGLQSRPKDVVEAARVDGAGTLGVFRHVTLPHLRGYLELGATLGAIYIVQNFDFVYSMTAGAFGTANLPYTVYRTFFQAHDYGLASAMGVIVVLGTILMVTLLLRSFTSLLREEALR
jgi:sorbitol/mannitol transport system permease protein